MLCFKTNTIISTVFVYSVSLFSLYEARALLRCLGCCSVSSFMYRIVNRILKFVSRYVSNRSIMYRYTPTHKSNSAYYFNDYTQLQSIFLLSVYYWKMPPGNASRTPRRELSLTDKVKLIRESEATKKSVCVLAEQFKCGKTQVSTYLTAFEENADKDRKILCLKSPLEELSGFTRLGLLTFLSAVPYCKRRLWNLGKN